MLSNANFRSALVGIVSLATLGRAPAAEIVTLNTPRTFPAITNRIQWQDRVKEIRAQVQTSCGLWPAADRTPLNPQIFDRVEHADYSTEKVVLETSPGVFLGGNLYRPLRQTTARYPGILSPHGHWSEGRLVDNDTGSVPARCIQFARMGMVAFAYDMVGYNDTAQFSPRNPDGSLKFPAYYDGHVRFAQDPTNQLWGISLMGLQTWNSMRALDFLASLPDVDPTRLACTGASGGGTQTFMLGSIDDRLAAQAPVNMVSHIMQGGCWCENAPGLRVRFSNMEIDAAAAPRPQLLVSATGDWTKDTLKVEGPSIADIYRLYGPGDQLIYKQFDFPHNYNKTSREAVYAFMAEYLLNRAREDSLPELDYKLDDPKALRIWSDRQIPKGSKSAEEYKDYLIDQTREHLARLWPQKRSDLKSFKTEIAPFYRAVFELNPDPQEFDVKLGMASELADGARVANFEITAAGATHSIPVRVVVPRRHKTKTAVLLANPVGMSTSFDTLGNPAGLARELLAAGHTVVAFDGFLTGSRADNAEKAKRNPTNDFFTTYNRTDLQEHVGDLVTLCAFARSHLPEDKIVLSGTEQAGLWALLAAPAADAVIADANEFDADNDQLWIQPSWLTPSIRRIGTFVGPALMAAPNPVLIHNAGRVFPTKTISETYLKVAGPGIANVHPERLTDAALLNWIAGL